MDDVLVTLRRDLHAIAEPAFCEVKTARTVADRLRVAGIEIIADDVAGHGILARIAAGQAGAKRILVRSELDALPFSEATGVGHAAEHGHHACGHDGHMTMLLGALEAWADDPPCEIWALFQPAEETGEGMPAALAHEAFPQRFDQVLAIHNVPGHPLGTVLLPRREAAVASTGLRIRLKGATSHAAEPGAGNNPIPALARLIPLIEHAADDGDEAAVAALVEVAGGGPNFGTSAGDAMVAATLRAASDKTLEQMIAPLIDAAGSEADRHGFGLSVEHVEPFPAAINDAGTVEVLEQALADAGIATASVPPFPWSEDFAHALQRWPGALVGLGSGEDQPALHRPDYDFPDALIAPGIDVWKAMVEALA